MTARKQLKAALLYTDKLKYREAHPSLLLLPFIFLYQSSRAAIMEHHNPDQWFKQW